MNPVLISTMVVGVAISHGVNTCVTTKCVTRGVRPSLENEAAADHRSYRIGYCSDSIQFVNAINVINSKTLLLCQFCFIFGFFYVIQNLYKQDVGDCFPAEEVVQLDIIVKSTFCLNISCFDVTINLICKRTRSIHEIVK